MFKLLTILLSLKAINSLKYKLNEIVTGLPRAFEYETVYSNDDSNGKTRAAFSYYISVSTVEDYPIYFVAGLKEDINENISCSDAILTKENRTSVFVKEFPVSDKGIQENGVFWIDKTGLYSHFLVSCAYENGLVTSVNTTVKGSIIYTNPDGFLPAHKSNYPKFYLVLVIIYMSASIYWIFKCHKNKKNILFYHYIIVFLLLSTFFESILLFLYYEILNFSVASHSALKTVSKLMLIGRKMLSRMVVLLICSGVGITKETISTNEKKSAASFFALFFIFSLFNEVQKNSFGYKSEIVAFVYFALSLMDVLLYAWAYYKLFLVLRRIGKNNKFKYSVYLKLTVLTIFGCLASVVFCTAEIIFVSSRKYTEVANWHYFLFYDVGFWEILFMYFICVVMKVLSPEIEISKYTQIENNAGDIEEHIEEKTKRLLSGSDNLSSFSDSEEEDVQKDVDLAADSTKSDDNGDDKSNKDIESEKKNENNQIDNDKTNDNDTKLKDFNINNDQTDEKTNVDETEKKINVDETDQKNIQKENKSTKN